MANEYRYLPSTCNQARGIGQYAIDFLQSSAAPAEAVLEKLKQFHLDSIACAVAALSGGTSAPHLLRKEALEYPVLESRRGAACFGSTVIVQPEKAVVANCSAVRELDANGTNFGYNPRRGDVAGEFGHNDYYPVAVAAAQQAGYDGRQLLLAMLCLDEIRGRLAEVFALKNYKIDHVVHGAIASAAVYCAMLGGTPEQIESAIGMVVAHYVPFRAIRHGHQLSDSKGASAAISAEVAVLSARRALRGFVGPADVFRNPQAIFCLFEPPSQTGQSPFDLELALGGDDFAVMGMHFKLGMYEHQSAGAIEGLIQLLVRHPEILQEASQLRRIRIAIYEPAYSIIGDPHKRDPRTRQSADHSMVYIVATLLRKALESQQSGWQELMLVLEDYSDAAISHPLTRQLMERIEFVHGGTEFDKAYPDGIPTSVEIDHAKLGPLKSGLVMYPLGHARHSGHDLAQVLEHKFRRFASSGMEDVETHFELLRQLDNLDPAQVRLLYNFPLRLPQ